MLAKPVEFSEYKSDDYVVYRSGWPGLFLTITTVIVVTPAEPNDYGLDVRRKWSRRGTLTQDGRILTVLRSDDSLEMMQRVGEWMDQYEASEKPLKRIVSDPAFSGSWNG